MSIDKLLTDTSADLRNRIAKEPIPPPPRLIAPPLRQTRGRPSWLVGIVSFTVILGAGVIALLLQAPNPQGPIHTPEPVPPTAASPAPDTSLEAISEPTLFDAGPLTDRDGHSVVWTGSELIVWGGVLSDGSGATLADGAAYDPSSNSWRLLAAAPIAPRQGHQAAWTGEEMLVVGGLGHVDGAAYNPDTDTWRLLPSTPVPTTSPAPMVTQYTSSVWDGQELVMWNVPADLVAAYSPATDSWSHLGSTNLEVDAGVLRWNGAELYAFAVEAFDPTVSQLRVARLDSEQWTRLADLEIPAPMPMLSAWTGEEFISWNDAGESFRYLEVENVWESSPAIPISGCEGVGEPLETERVVLVFNWCGVDALLDVATGEWTTLQVPGLGRGSHAVWTGEEVLLWGDLYGNENDPSAILAWRLSP